MNALAMSTECTVNCKGCAFCLTEMLNQMTHDDTLWLNLNGIYIDIEREYDRFNIVASLDSYTMRTLDESVIILCAYANGVDY